MGGAADWRGSRLERAIIFEISCSPKIADLVLHFFLILKVSVDSTEDTMKYKYWAIFTEVVYHLFYFAFST